MKNNQNNMIINLLLKAVGQWLLTDHEFDFVGSKDEVKTLSNVLMASKDFYTYVRNPDINFDIEVFKALLNRKQMAAYEFEQCFNVVWPF